MRVLALMMMLSSAAVADDAGRKIFEQEYAASHGYGDLTAELSMQLVSRSGRVTERALRLQQMETDGSVKTLIVFDEPKPIRGTGLLTFSQALAEDDQWLYLPAIKRVKKIASRDRSGPFVGSEFAYEDLADYQVEEFTYAWLREEPCGDLVCDVVERTPRDPYSGYQRQHVWVDNTHRQIRAVDYFDKAGQPLKTMRARDFRSYQVGDRAFLQPHEIEMHNLQTSRRTVLYWRSYSYQQGLVEPRDFTTNALRRVR